MAGNVSGALRMIKSSNCTVQHLATGRKTIKLSSSCSCDSNSSRNNNSRTAAVVEVVVVTAAKVL